MFIGSLPSIVTWYTVESRFSLRKGASDTEGWTHGALLGKTSSLPAQLLRREPRPLSQESLARPVEEDAVVSGVSVKGGVPKEDGNDWRPGAAQMLAVPAMALRGVLKGEMCLSCPGYLSFLICGVLR